MPDTPDLKEVHAHAWEALIEATKDKESPYRCLTLGTVDRIGQPQLRTLILRDVSRDIRQLEFHTDIRSPKWKEITIRPNKISVLGYDPLRRVQLRFVGRATLLGPHSAMQDATWNELPPWTRLTYCGNASGQMLEQPQEVDPDALPPDPADTAHGQANFGVVSFQAERLDWYQHGRELNRRAIFDYSQADRTYKSRWVAP